MSVRDHVERLRKDEGPLPQVELRWLGGLKTIAGRLTFYRGTLAFLMLIPVAYNSSPTIQGMFPDVYWFAGAMVVLLGAAAVVEYSVVYPSQLLFNKAQASKNDRDPIYRKAKQNERKLDRVLDRLEAAEAEYQERDER